MIQFEIHVVEVWCCITINIIPEVTGHDGLVEECTGGTHEGVHPAIIADMITLTFRLDIRKHSSILHLPAVKFSFGRASEVWIVNTRFPT